MTTTSARVLLRHLRTCVAEENTDHQLLEQFAKHRAEAAFEALVRRHGPLVQGVCRRVLRHEHDAEDAFQATFLVLARKARDVGRQGSVAGWLHRVAFHAAIKARARTANRDRHERQVAPREPADLLDEVTGRELLTVLDEELQKLSDDCRTSLVLCYLEGHTCDEAARHLGWSVRTLKRRLEQARRCLRTRLARRGIALPGALLALGLTQKARAGVPAALAATTVARALSATTGVTGTTTGAGALAEAVLRGTSSIRFKVAAAALVLTALLFGVGVLEHGAQAQRPDPIALGTNDTPAASEPGKPLPPVKNAAEAKTTAITGRVLDADGKPISGAQVTGYGGLDLGSLSFERREKAFGDVKTNDEGRFRLPLPDIAGERYDRVQILAGARGYGLAWSPSAVSIGRVDAYLDEGTRGNGLTRTPAPADRPDVEVRLPSAEPVVGRLLDLQGQPLARARLRPIRVLPVVDKVPQLGGGKDDKMMERVQQEMVELIAKLKSSGGKDDATKRLLDLKRLQHTFEFRKDSPLKDSSLWPAAVTSDRDGRFRLDGFGKGQEVHLVVEDDQVASQEIVVEVGAKERSFSLVPPHKVTGRVLAADTDKPVAGAWVGVSSFQGYQQGFLADAATDAEGRFSVNAFPGDSYTVQVYPPRDVPYLTVFKTSDWPKGAVKQEVEFKLPRGAVVQGKVVEAGTGKALVSASVAFIPQRENNPQLPRGIITGSDHKSFTGPDGTFQIIVPPGPGHLVVTGPNADYAYRSISEAELQSGKPGGAPRHFHAVLPIDLRATDDPKEASIELRRSLTIEGQVVGPDGKLVKNAVVFLPSELLPGVPFFFTVPVGVPPGTRLTAVQVRDGSFELSNCNPDETYRVFVLSGRPESETLAVAGPGLIDTASVVNRLIVEKAALGAIADISTKNAGGKPVPVKLSPCESAEVRFVDAQGKAVQQKVWLELLVKPGPSGGNSRAEGKPAAEAALLATPYSLRGEKSPVAPDAEGRITLPGLIPGATYRLKVLSGQTGQENELILERDFTVEAGKKTKLELVAP